MGLDIHLITDNSEEISRLKNTDNQVDFFNQHSLSRTFCNLMSRRDVIQEETELDQISRLTETDISVLYEMEQYWNEMEVDFHLSFAETENDKKKVLEQIANNRKKIGDNINKVLETIETLIQKLSKLGTLNDKLDSHEIDTLDNDYYFTDFNLDKGEGYIGNNFGQDLRNFRRFLEYAKANGANAVWFDYG
jgi:DNA repair exonuclease SbcCD ATPase subunit